MKKHNVQSSAAALYDGGWRASDRDQLMTEHDLTAADADAICAELERIDDTPKHISLDNGSTYATAADAIPEITARGLWAEVVSMMDDATREAVHRELAPCTEVEFLTRYLEIADEDLLIG